MIERYEAIREIDLFAYADGQLEVDLPRKDEVERYLAANPDAAALVAEIRAQNDEIRAHHGAVLREPVPVRLSAVLHGGSAPRSGRRLAQIAAAVALLVASSLTGWFIGQRDQDAQWALSGFVERAAAVHSGTAADPSATPAAADAAIQPLGWLNQRIALELTAPDLTGQGFDLMAKEMLGPDSDPMVRLLYQRIDGTAINLFLRPRWDEASSGLGRADAGDVNVLYWLDGPLAFAMTTNAAGVESDQLAVAIREAVERARLSDEAPTMALSPDTPAATQANGAEEPSLLAPVVPHSPAPDNGGPAVQVN
ncbi:MAG: anti-sigma factor family protein [Kiloniellaceae bacterium]